MNRISLLFAVNVLSILEAAEQLEYEEKMGVLDAGATSPCCNISKTNEDEAQPCHYKPLQPTTPPPPMRRSTRTQTTVCKRSVLPSARQDFSLYGKGAFSYY